VYDLHIVTSEIVDLQIDDITPIGGLDELRRKRYAPGKGAAAKRKGEKVRGYSTTDDPLLLPRAEGDHHGGDGASAVCPIRAPRSSRRWRPRGTTTC
jgi:hypothetical protein